MTLSVNSVMAVTEYVPRVFSVRSMRDLKRLFPGGTPIKLRMPLEDAAAKFHDPTSCVEAKVEDLGKLGITENGISINKLEKAFNPTGTKLEIPKWLVLRRMPSQDEKTLDNYIRAILGRIAEEDVFGETNVHVIIKNERYPFEEKIEIAAAYLETFRNDEAGSDDFLASLSAEIAEAAYPDNIDMQNELVSILADRFPPQEE